MENIKTIKSNVYVRENEFTEKQKINSYLFELSLWKKVRISDPESAEFIFDNAEYVDDVLFPVIKVGGYNELNGFNEEFELSCYMYNDDMSRSDWREEYERNGSSPAAKTPQEVMIYILDRKHYIKFILSSLGYDTEGLTVEDDEVDENIIDLSIEDMQQIIDSISSTQELVDAYVETCYKYAFYEDAEYDHEEGTEEYEVASALTDSWSKMMDDLEARVLNAASDEGMLDTKLADQGTAKQLEAFMDKYGYHNGGSWWIKKDT